ncbi:MAG: class I SAM-dependent methyltransferase [Rhodospirillales bacterium]|jgi:cyclopropane fatty-acyl-phospholipid synthase-like methyltransferase|nr:class I SAM-dependent methyltransferase [Rhodospirillales bacterium]
MTNPTSISRNEFYQAYDRKGQGAYLKPKHVRQFRKDFVQASGCRPGMSVLELGCGNGLFLRFLAHLGADNFMGVDGDPRIMDELPAEIASSVHILDFVDFFSSDLARERFDRVVLFDVLEHFTPDDAAILLRSVAGLLPDDGRVVIRVPNMASPLALGVQYNDVTHRTAFSAGSIRQVASVAGLEPVAFQPQAYSSWYREIRERALTSVVSWFLATPPMIWSPNLIAVLKKNAG